MAGQRGTGGGGGTDESDAERALDAIFDDELKLTDLPRSAWATSREALADLDRRIEGALSRGNLGPAWATQIRTWLQAAELLRRQCPHLAFPVTAATARLDLFAELDALSPRLIETSFAREVDDDALLAAVVNAWHVMMTYHRSLPRNK